MAKRVRGSTSRPGQRPPLQRAAARPATRPSTQPTATTAPVSTPEPFPDDLTDEEEARAAALEAAIVAEERQAEATKDRARATRPSEMVRPVSNLTISTAEEYQYVARDVRRIAIVGGSLVLILLGMWALSHILGMGPL
jgi:hypothetical protein